MSEGQTSVETDETLRRKLLWAYGIIGALALLLVWSLLAGGLDTPKTAQPAAGTAQPVTTGDPAAACLQMLGEKKAAEALPLCREALERRPNEPGFQHNLAFAYKMSGDYEEAIRLFEGVVEKDPLNIRATYELAESYRGSGQIDTARATYSQVLQLQPNHGWAQRRLGELPN